MDLKTQFPAVFLELPLHQRAAAEVAIDDAWMGQQISRVLWPAMNTTSSIAFGRRIYGPDSARLENKTQPRRRTKGDASLSTFGARFAHQNDYGLG